MFQEHLKNNKNKYIGGIIGAGLLGVAAHHFLGSSVSNTNVNSPIQMSSLDELYGNSVRHFTKD